MELRIRSSNPDFEELNFWTNYRAQLINSYMFFDLRGLPDAERKSDIEMLDVYLKEFLEELTH